MTDKVTERVTAEDLALTLGVDASTLRNWLRSLPLKHSHGSRWLFSEDEASKLATEFRSKKRQSSNAEATGTMLSDQAYVLDLCDSILGVECVREYRFDWLRGDPGKDGRRWHLPVDGFYESCSLVVEYWERQHSEPVPHFDKPDRMTISNVPRREQRRFYDLRRQTEIPANGLKLVVIDFRDLNADKRARLVRDRNGDLEVLGEVLRPFVQMTAQSKP